MSMVKIRKVLIITSEPFPFGMAGTNRIISLGKGFSANGIDAQILSTYKFDQPDDIVKNPTKGVYEGITFTNIFNSTIKNRFKIIRAFQEFIKIILVFFYCAKKLNRETLVIYYSTESLSAIAVKVIAYIKNSVFVKEETEHPLIRIRDGKKFSTCFFLNYHYKIFDGLFVITQNLYNYFKTELNYKRPIFIVPMIVDVDRFIVRSKINSNCIVFSGELDDQKEGVDSLIRAFAKVLNKYPGYTLNLYGQASNEQEIRYRKQISDLKIEEKVIIQGYKMRNEMTEILLKAKLFVLTRPPSLQASYGFSTKLGEYLATGKPVVATRVGEIDNFLKDRVNAFICDSNIDSIADKICEIIEDYDFALKVGEEGRKCSLNYFNNKTETKSIIEQIQYIYSSQYDKTKL